MTEAMGELPNLETAPRGSAEEAGYFFAMSTKHAILRLQARIEILEDAFLKEHPMGFLPPALLTEEEEKFVEWATERGLL